MEYHVDFFCTDDPLAELMEVLRFRDYDSARKACDYLHDHGIVALIHEIPAPPTLH